MFCEEKITNVYLGQNAYHNIDGATCWFDCYHDIAFHTTEGYRLLLETEKYMISLSVDGVNIQSKKEFEPYDGEWLEETVHILEEETEDGIEREIIVDEKSTLFVGQRLHSVTKCNGHFGLEFDDFILKLIPYNLGDDIPRFQNKDAWAYNHVLGFDHLLKSRCPLCGGEGEILLDFVCDYVVRCKNCKKSTFAEMEIRHAIEHWNEKELQCDLSDIRIE